jgi:hypothetical protein
VADEGTGLRFSDLPDSDVYMDTVYIYLIVEWVVIMTLAVYLEQVLPSRFGVKKHPLFFLGKKHDDASAPPPVSAYCHAPKHDF